MAIAIALIVLLLASVIFHFMSPWYLTELASNWGSIDGTISISFWVCGFVFVAVNLFMAYCLIRFRHREGVRAKYEPENKKLELWLTIGTTIGVAALLAPGLLVWGTFVTPPGDAREFEVVGQQWHWTFRYPGEDGVFGAVSPKRISAENPFGMDPEDPRGRDDVLVNAPRAKIPMGRPIKAVLRSKDVIHNFQVAQFRAKMDLVPGQVSYLWLEPSRTGEFEILCAELCGIGHFAMRGMLEVVAEDEFNRWLAEQPTYGEILARGPGDPQRGEQLYATCTSCHGPQGQGNRQLNAPKLAGLKPWYVEQQLMNFREGIRGASEEDTYGQQMRPFANTLADRQAIRDVSAYIGAFEAEPVEETVAGNEERGLKLFRTCGACHGPDGQGSHARRAPKLAGMSDWYLTRQLEHFKQGIRGDHPKDLYGRQMSEMAEMLTDGQAISDVVAYINTLPQARQTGDSDTGLAGRND